MAFTLSSGTTSYSLPMPPQQWTYQPKPRKSVEKTLGGQVVQLLGYSYEGSFGGLIHGGQVLKRDDLSKGMAWADMVMLKQFMTLALANQKAGGVSHIKWDEEHYDFDCALGDLSIREDLTTVGYTYSIQFWQTKIGETRDGSAYATTLNRLLKEIGDMNANAYHGGSGDISSIQPMTGFNEFGPTVSSSSSSSSGSTAPTSDIQQYAHDQVIARGWTEADFTALVELWNHESNWNPTADNPYSDAYGIPQAMYDPNTHPELFSGKYADYKTNWKTQVDWGLNYIKNRYGSPTAAWRFWNDQKNTTGSAWY